MKTAVNNAFLIPGDGTYLKNACVLIENDRISAIGTEPFDADLVIDAGGDALLPGFIDSHVHLGTKVFPNGSVSFGGMTPEEAGIRAASQARNFFKSGITTLRAVGTACGADIYLRNMERAGEVSVPRILASGRVLCITTGHCYDIGIECDTVGEIRKAAREQVKRGVDWLKMMPTSGVIGVGPASEVELSEEQIKAVCDVGRAFNTPTCAHVMNREALVICVNAGLTCVEHGTAMDEETAQMMVDKGTWYVSTRIVTLREATMFDENDPDPSVKKMKYAAAGLQERWSNALRTAIKAGVKMGLGTDSGCPFTNPDTFAYAGELELHTEAGMSNMDVLVTATANNAKLLGIDDETGTVETGKKADLVLLKGNPLEDIKAARDVRMTIHDGRVCYKA